MTSQRVWLITGASSGFGRSMTELVLKKGENVVATLRNPDMLLDLASQYNKDRLLVLKVDVRNRQEILNAFDKGRTTFGRLDVVFNNAGYGAVGEVEGTPDDLARDLFETNFWGAVNISKEAIRFFRDVNKPGVGGRLLQMSSMVGIFGRPMVGFYSASKFALEGISEALAQELNPEWNIKVTIIEPGAHRTKAVVHSGNLVDTPIHPAYNDPKMLSYMARQFIKSMEFDGDADKAVQAMFNLANLPEPPLRLPLGKDSLEVIKGKIASVMGDVDKYESWSENLLYD